MNKKELILLDACLVSVIDENAFGAELRNGHEIVAYLARDDFGTEGLEIGDSVQVEMSPFDMSKGRLVLNRG